jgi:hypothetical protein
MTPLAKAQIKWLEDCAKYDGDICRVWPFYRLKGGYGKTTKINGVQYLSHRWICEKIKGPPPTKKHEAAHSCGRGTSGCVTPLHVSWKTAQANRLEKRNHGTAWRGGNKLTPIEIEKIRAIGRSVKQRDLAKMFGVSQGNISMILNKKAWTVSIGVSA